LENLFAHGNQQMEIYVHEWNLPYLPPLRKPCLGLGAQSAEISKEEEKMQLPNPLQSIGCELAMQITKYCSTASVAIDLAKSDLLSKLYPGRTTARI
jgi:hypothetical protein